MNFNLETWETDAFANLAEGDPRLRIFSRRIVTLIERLRIAERVAIQAQNRATSLATQKLEMEEELKKYKSFFEAEWV